MEIIAHRSHSRKSLTARIGRDEQMQDHGHEIAVEAQALVSGARTNCQSKFVQSTFVKIPCDTIGLLLDGDEAHFACHALHLVAIKESTGKGMGHALNERHVGKPFALGGYGIGRRGFRGGIALMKKRGVLEREQKGRKTFARERLRAGSKNYVAIEEVLLKNPSKLVAFILVVNLSPTPINPIVAASRLGITSPTTAHRLAQQALEQGAVERVIGPKNQLWVARKGFQFGKNVPEHAKNVLTKNGDAHSSLHALTATDRKAQDYTGGNLVAKPPSGSGSREQRRGDPSQWTPDESRELYSEHARAEALEAIEIYNDAAERFGFLPCQLKTSARLTKLVQRLAEIGGLGPFRKALEAINNDDFLMGRVVKPGREPFVMTFERLMSTGSGLGDVLARLVEGINAPALGSASRTKKSDLKPYWYRGREALVPRYELDFWKHIIGCYANGTWPVEFLGPGPWDREKCLVPPVLLEKLRLREKYPTADGKGSMI